MTANPFSGAVYVLRAKRADRIKLALTLRRPNKMPSPPPKKFEGFPYGWILANPAAQAGAQSLKRFVSVTALGQNFTPSPTARRAQACSGARAQSARKDAGVDRSRPRDAWFCA